MYTRKYVCLKKMKKNISIRGWYTGEYSLIKYETLSRTCQISFSDDNDFIRKQKVIR